jgi:hypothetical protein
MELPGSYDMVYCPSVSGSFLSIGACSVDREECDSEGEWLVLERSDWEEETTGKYQEENLH